MDSLEIYTLVLCLVVLFGLVAFFLYFLTIGLKQRIKLINYGDEDQDIKTEYQTEKKPNVIDWISQIFTIVVTVVLCAIFAFSVYVNLTEDKRANGIPSLKVVRSASMSYKNSKNQYLVDNDLNDQFQVYDLIITRHLPDEFELKLYDIVVYQAENGDMIIHRIVGIEEPNENHPEHRHFKLQGDAIMYADTYPVLYSQMRGIYQGERMPFVGSFIMFMQSPAGYFCIALIVLAVIGLPLVEKKIDKIKRARYAVIIASQQTALTIDEFDNNPVLVTNPFAHLVGKRDDRTFDEKLQSSTDIVKNRFYEINDTLCRIKGVRIIESKKGKTYKVGNLPIAKITFRGKTLNVCLGLNPSEYQDSKYIFTDFTMVKAYAKYPMRVKLSSDRQTKWTNELISILMAKNGLEFVKVNPFAHLAGKRDDRTFDQKLADSKDIVKNRFYEVDDTLCCIDGVRVTTGKKNKIYKVGNLPIAKLTFRGKTLNVLLALSPSEYQDSKYIFTDLTSVKAHANYPMRVKLSSDRQARWTTELIRVIMAKNGLQFVKVNPFAHLVGKRDDRTFEQKLESLPIASQRYTELEQFINQIDGVRLISGKNSRTFKIKNNPIVKFAIRGKTLNAYVALKPKVFKDTKYIFVDCSKVKAYENYPMRVKATSNRQVKWIKELILEVIKGVGYEL